MRRRSLRFSITLTLLLFVSASSGLFALAMDYVNDRMERGLLDDTLEQEFEEFEQGYRQEQRLSLPYSSQMRSYLVNEGEQGSLPRPLRDLAPGQYHEVRMDGLEFHVLHRLMDGKHVYITLDITKNEEREDRFGLFLLMGVLLASGIAVWVGYLLSRRLIAPVTELAERVSQIEPGQTQRVMTADFAGAEVEVIAQAFDRFLQRLGRFIDREHAFTRDASHELRTPMAVINSSSELLLADPQLAENPRLPLQRILRASRQMSRLTRALLLLAREPGSEVDEHETCRVDVVVAQAVEDCRQLHPARVVELRTEDGSPLVLPVPPEFLEIVVINLVQNALMHAQQGSVRVGLSQTVLTVEDTGQGIHPDDLTRIFDRDYRGTGSRGIGRGLDLVRRICERLGWRIEVASELNWGTRFDVHLQGRPPPASYRED